MRSLLKRVRDHRTVVHVKAHHGETSLVAKKINPLLKKHKIYLHFASSLHYNDVIMGAIASQITSLTIVYSIVYSVADQRKHQSSASLAFVREIHRGPFIQVQIKENIKAPRHWPLCGKFTGDRLFRYRSKKTSKLRVTGLCAGNSPGTGEFPAQMASYAENVSIWWRHHEAMRWCK